jgi:hypothetical protein
VNVEAAHQLLPKNQAEPLFHGPVPGLACPVRENAKGRRSEGYDPGANAQRLAVSLIPPCPQCCSQLPQIPERSGHRFHLLALNLAGQAVPQGSCVNATLTWAFPGAGCCVRAGFVHYRFSYRGMASCPGVNEQELFLHPEASQATQGHAIAG